MTETMTVKCSCKVCAVNAPKVGLALPLRAEVPMRLAEQLNLSPTRNAHGVIHLAHDPNAITGAAARRQTGIVAVTA